MSSPNTKPFHVAVCGGGIGGLCLTIGLLEKGISCSLYESAAAFSEVGAGVSFGPNALEAMRLLSPAIDIAYKRRATSNGWPEKRRNWFEFRIGMTEEGWKDMKAPGREGQKIAQTLAGESGQSSIHRAHFLEELVKLVPSGVANFGKRVENVEKKGSKILITFLDGSLSEADALIGCDGVKSRTRQVLLGQNSPFTNPTFTGKYAYRGLIPMRTAVDAIGDELARNSQMYLGHHSHILTFPIEKGNTMNVVAFHTKSDGVWDDEQWVLRMQKEDMLKDFEGWGDNVRCILSMMEKPDVWALFDHPPASTYYNGNFAILGDAAHASTPHCGAGAGQAIEDAFILSNLLGDAALDEIERAFHAYDAVRRPRTQLVVTKSRETGGIYEFEDELLGSDLNLIRETLETRYTWIWNENLHEQLEKARAIMRSKM